MDAWSPRVTVCPVHGCYMAVSLGLKSPIKIIHALSSVGAIVVAIKRVCHEQYTLSFIVSILRFNVYAAHQVIGSFFPVLSYIFLYVFN